MAYPPQDRLVAKEVALGQIRDLPFPETHIGVSTIAPLLPVIADDVIFSFITPDVDGLAPARAEDAEAEMAQKDDTVGTGRASLLDWAIKDHYDPSDVSRYREFLRVAETAAGTGAVPLLNGVTDDFAARVARDDRSRRRKLDNRLEWMIWRALETNTIAYNDGKVVFSVSFGRPANQTLQAPANGYWDAAAATPDGFDSDPIGDFYTVDEFMYETHGVRLSGGTAFGSRKAWNALTNSSRWLARTGLLQGTGTVPTDPSYLIDGWGDGTQAVRQAFSRATGVTAVEYDSVYPTRAIGSTTVTRNRFLRDDVIVFLPDMSFINEVDGTGIGFGKTLTSPHVEGNWTSGYYEWEKVLGPDPWGLDRGTGIKAFPVFPHLQYSYVLQVLEP